ncbi:MAG TPA: hypothetical protein VD860_14225 [Azospirillum sp.]|nr:hypothetical protein [Azospirillum sp.]
MKRTTKAMTIEQVQARLRTAHARIGNEGRFALTLSLTGTPGGAEEAYLTHWFRPDPYAFEDCKAVGSGTVAECLAALERYVAGYRRQPTLDEVGRTLGLVPSAVDEEHEPGEHRFLVAAE